MPSIEPYSHHWLSRFLLKITKGCNSNAHLESVFKNLKVINFNYDRCFERFVKLWMRNVYQIDESSAIGIMSNLKLIHPYGSLGPLSDGYGSGVPFGYDPSPDELFEISNSIFTYSESIDKDKRHFDISAEVNFCTSIVFFGFGFHQQNMTFFREIDRTIPRNIFATNVEIPRPRWEGISTDILKIFGEYGEQKKY